jgi:hypothetical protein
MKAQHELLVKTTPPNPFQAGSGSNGMNDRGRAAEAAFMPHKSH